MTFGGEACSLAAAVETVKEMKENKLEIFTHIWKQGERLRTAFNKYAELIGVDAEMFGFAPRHNIKFNHEDSSGCKDIFHQEMIKRGVLMGTQIYTTWAHKDDDITNTIGAMCKSLDVVKKAVYENSIDKYIDGERSLGIFKKIVSEKEQ